VVLEVVCQAQQVQQVPAVLTVRFPVPQAQLVPQALEQQAVQVQPGQQVQLGLLVLELTEQQEVQVQQEQQVLKVPVV
jgi:hypothetical protein